MPERIQRTKTASKQEAAVEEATPAKEEAGEALKNELDDLLDEIDEVLEENAQEFVASYIQQGGQ